MDDCLAYNNRII
jgi:hypothetical protein